MLKKSCLERISMRHVLSWALGPEKSVHHLCPRLQRSSDDARWPGATPATPMDWRRPSTIEVARCIGPDMGRHSGGARLHKKCAQKEDA